jgi:methylenetetrahydrofolate dehydrogenase (NADP+)/methenyltetrahydrofolate cyclohydrolase
MTTIIDGRKIKKEILAEVKKEIATLPFQPVFCDVLVGDDPASAQYVQMKSKAAESLGIKFHNAHFSENVSTEDLVEEIKKLNNFENMCGLIVQLPLPVKFDKQIILDAVSPAIDVDCLGTETSNLFYSNEGLLGFPTAIACVKILDSLNIDISKKKIVVLGQGILVGKPVAHILRTRNLNVDIVTKKTENKNELIKNADIIISGIGHGKFITGDMIKKDVIIIDAGTSESTGSIVGDVDLDSVLNIASFVSPVPGGVGPVTVAILLQNVLTVAKNRS